MHYWLNFVQKTSMFVTMASLHHFVSFSSKTKSFRSYCYGMFLLSYCSIHSDVMLLSVVHMQFI